jgi:hypothetical protein
MDSETLVYGISEMEALDDILQNEVNLYGEIVMPSALLACYILVQCGKVLNKPLETEYCLNYFEQIVGRYASCIGYRLLGHAYAVLDKNDRAQELFNFAAAVAPRPERRQSGNGTFKLMASGKKTVASYKMPPKHKQSLFYNAMPEKLSPVARPAARSKQKTYSL